MLRSTTRALKEPSNINDVIHDVILHDRYPYLSEEITLRVDQISRDTFRKEGHVQRVATEILADWEYIRKLWRHLHSYNNL